MPDKNQDSTSSDPQQENAKPKYEHIFQHIDAWAGLFSHRGKMDEPDHILKAVFSSPKIGDPSTVPVLLA